MAQTMIPKEAVEAAAEAITSGLRTKSIADLARAALEAGAPHMRSDREKSFDIPTESDDGLLGWALDEKR